MRARDIIPVLIAAAAIGWFAPDLVDRAGGADGGRSEASAETPAAGTPSLENAWLAGATVIDRHPDGHFYALVTVAARDYRFLVDTGASVVALTGPDARDMGLHWDDSELRPIGRGASGEVYGVPITIDHIELGGFGARNVRAAIIPEGLPVSLLGQTFLSQISRVRIDGDRMVLGG